MLKYKNRMKSDITVPRNSVLAFNQRGILDGNKTVQCPHCENMAKNFLYFESLLRNNYNPKLPCKLCFASLKYLQFVNKSILSVFGKCDAVVNAANTFFCPIKKTPRLQAGRTNNTRPKKQKISGKKTKSSKAGGNCGCVTSATSSKAKISHSIPNKADSSAPKAIQVTAAANSHQYSANPKHKPAKSKDKVSTKTITEPPAIALQAKPILRRSTTAIKKIQQTKRLVKPT